MHEDGRYTEELTLIISLIDVDNETINEIAGDLCIFFHQESVLITEDRVKAYYINPSEEPESLQKKELSPETGLTGEGEKE